MKESVNTTELTPREVRLLSLGFRWNIHGELSMPADQFILRWEAQHPVRSNLDADGKWWVESTK